MQGDPKCSWGREDSPGRVNPSGLAKDQAGRPQRPAQRCHEPEIPGRVSGGARPCRHPAFTLPASRPVVLSRPVGEAATGLSWASWSPACCFRLNPGEPFLQSSAQAGGTKDRPSKPASCLLEKKPFVAGKEAVAQGAARTWCGEDLT